MIHGVYCMFCLAAPELQHTLFERVDTKCFFGAGEKSSVKCTWLQEVIALHAARMPPRVDALCFEPTQTKTFESIRFLGVGDWFAMHVHF